MKKCLICFEPVISDDGEYHQKCSKSLFGTKSPPLFDYDLSQIEYLAKEAIQQHLTIPGVQTKLSLTYENLNKNNRLTIVGLLNGLFVLKPPHSKYPELPENESLIMSLAEICGIETAVHGMIRFKSGELAYIAKRFDRVVKNKKLIKLAQEDMCQLSELLTEDKYQGSMEKVAKIILNKTTNNVFNLLIFLDVALFSFLIGNADMHLKNFSLLKDTKEIWKISPAYDLVSTILAETNDLDEMALTLNGKKRKLSQNDFKTFAIQCQILTKSFENTMKRFQNSLPRMYEKINISFLSEDRKKTLITHINSKAKRLALV